LWEEVAMQQGSRYVPESVTYNDSQANFENVFGKVLTHHQGTKAQGIIPSE
jgi:hypothetical protein